MRKFFKKSGRLIFFLFESLFKLIDKIIVMPLSRLIYNISKLTSSNNTEFNRLLNRPHFILVISLILSLLCFKLIDGKVVSLVENEAETIKNVPVTVIYNEETFVVENVPETVDITITGRKSDIYLAKQLGEFAVELDLSKYTEPGTYKAYFTYAKSINGVKYVLDPSYLIVNIKDRVSEVHTVAYDLVNTDNLDPKLSVGSVSLNTTEVIVKGAEDTLSEITTIKALVDVAASKDGKNYTQAGTYEKTDIPLVAYDNKGHIIDNVEIVPNTLTGTLVLKSYKVTVPIQVITTGKLISGKSIASISINGAASYSLDIYGEESEIKDIKTVPVTVNVDGAGGDAVKNYSVSISKPNGVRYMTAKDLSITLTFGNEEEPKLVAISTIDKRNLADGYTANIVSGVPLTVQVKGVASNIAYIEASNIKAYVDLTGLTEGTHEVTVKVENNNPLLNYVVETPVTIKITKD